MPHEATKAIQVLRRYASGDKQYAKQNAEIDNRTRKGNSEEEDITDGHHFFLEGHVHRAKQVLTFCAALEKRISEIDKSDSDMPLPWTIKYIGYTESAADRIASCIPDRSQSWLSELVRNVLRYLFAD